MDEGGIPAEVLDLGGGLLAALVVDIGNGDGGALAGEHEGRRPAHAGAPAGDDGNLAFELSRHNSLLRCFDAVVFAGAAYATGGSFSAPVSER